ncbi:MAG TPA: endolytic transglycosylase MltG [Candidatus Saccharimonadales bacterium]|nr:endolytic transglycosylase MltG [Candidatus Saccharimonadales bacterium]
MPETKPIIKHKQQPINGQPSGLKIPKKPPLHKNWLTITGLVVAALIIISAISGLVWFQIQLSPAGSDTHEFKKITIAENSTSSQISKQLQDQKIIRSSVVFDIYVRLSSKGSSLQAGTYRLSPSDSIPEIVDHFTKGSVDQYNITFYPGSTLVDNTSKPENQKQDVTTVLKKAGYSESEISAALGDTYDTSNDKVLFTGKPASADLEGYIYGDTFSINDGASVHDILQKALDKFYSVVEDNNLIASFSSHNLSLYQGITLASIVQREASTPKDQAQVAQVFYSRLSQGMMLGSDVTYQYIADKTGVPRDPNIDSPYNTRRFTGLPPGPIATPGLSALQAVATPASGDYLYFLAGDDGTMYFAHTSAEHDANIAKYCKINCSTP